MTAVLGALVGFGSRKILATDVAVFGVHRADRLAVIQTIQPWMRHSLVFFPSQELAATLVKKFAFREVRVETEWPDRLVVRATERSPSMWQVSDAGIFELDEEGYRIQPAPPGSDSVPLLVQGCDPSAAVDGSPSPCVRGAASIYRALRYSSVGLANVSVIEVRGEVAEVWLRGGLRVRLGSMEALPEKMSMLARVLTNLREKGHSPQRIDVLDPLRPIAQLRDV